MLEIRQKKQKRKKERKKARKKIERDRVSVIKNERGRVRKKEIERDNATTNEKDIEGENKERARFLVQISFSGLRNKTSEKRNKTQE